ncbi:MAG TPA: FG-GAP-like repeat-containing protein [Terriglobales bacterium]|nr:FG-GAP-like repeat-containing protein [Terriglobales bacterium]
MKSSRLPKSGFLSPILLSCLALAFLAVLLGADTPADPGEAARLNNLGAAYLNQQLFDKALKAFAAARAADSALKIAELNRGIALLNLQKLDEARPVLEKAVKDLPEDAHAWFNLGLYHRSAAHGEDAVAAFRRVTEIDAGDADSWYFLGASYAQLRKFPEAIAAFERALKIDPLHASAQFGMAQAYQHSGDSDAAVPAFRRFQYITQNKLGTPISQAYGEQGKYSLAEDSPLAVPKVPAQIEVKFVDVTREAGLATFARTQSTEPILRASGQGACFLDYDNDGNIDLLVTDNGPSRGISLYHNTGGGQFEDVSTKVGLDPKSHGVGCTAGDYDNDGATDLVIMSDARVRLLHNEKNGTFKDVTEPSGIHATGGNSATFVDFDHDGDLDLYIAGMSRSVMPLGKVAGVTHVEVQESPFGAIWRNNGNGTFADVTHQTGLTPLAEIRGAIGTDFNNDRAVDLVATGDLSTGGIVGGQVRYSPVIFKNPREGKFQQNILFTLYAPTNGVTALDFNHDGWMDLAFTQDSLPGVSLWQNDHGKVLTPVALPRVDWAHGYGIVAFDYDNDGWVDLAAVGETKDGRGEVRLFRNLGPDGWKDVTADVGLDKIELKNPRAIIAGDYDNDGAVDLLITQNHGPAVLLRNVGGNKNNSLRLALKGLADNKSAIGTKVEVFSDGIRQKFEVYGSSGYLGQNSPYLTIGLGQAKQADVVRLLWPTGVLQDEVEVAAGKLQTITEIDRRGSSCPTLFAWDGEKYGLVGDMLGAGVVGHWVGARPSAAKAASVPSEPTAALKRCATQRRGVAECNAFSSQRTQEIPQAEGSDDSSVIRNIPRPVEYIKIDRDRLREKGDSAVPLAAKSINHGGHGGAQGLNRRLLSFRFIEPLEESVYLDSVKLLAVDHPAGYEVYPNEYFASGPPYPEFKVVLSRGARPPAGAWDEHGHDLLPSLLAHKYFGDFKVTPFLGFAEPHSLELDLGEAYRGGGLWLLMHGEVEYFSANSMYAADQAGLTPFAPYVEAWVEDAVVPQRLKPHDSHGADGTAKAVPFHKPDHESGGKDGRGRWARIVSDLGFPAGGPRTMTANLTGKLPVGTRRIRLTTNLQIYWDSILVDRTERRGGRASISSVPLARASLGFHGFPLKIEGSPPGNVQYVYEKASATGPYTRPAGAYTRYGDVLPLLTSVDDKFVVFGSGDEVALEFDPASLPVLPRGWVRDYFFVADGYEKDMDFYAYRGESVEPLPFGKMRGYPYAGQKFPEDAEHLRYLLEYNTRFMSGKEGSGYAFRYH